MSTLNDLRRRISELEEKEKKSGRSTSVAKPAPSVSADVRRDVGVALRRLDTIDRQLEKLFAAVNDDGSPGSVTDRLDKLEAQTHHAVNTGEHESAVEMITTRLDNLTARIETLEASASRRRSSSSRRTVREELSEPDVGTGPVSSQVLDL